LRLAHLADLHLGFRAYHRLVAGGDGIDAPRYNAREHDVSTAFRSALDAIIEQDVDLVLVAGDIFHTVRPSNAAIAAAFRQFARLNAAMPHVPVVIIAGNHDSPRAVETGSILTLLQEIPNVRVVDREARVLEFPHLDAAVMCLPHSALAGGGLGSIDPTTDAGTQILMMHATVRGEEVDRLLGYVSEFGGAQVDIADIRVERWDYVALGHYHIATQLAPNMWYAGSLERTSTNIWIETSPKGFVTWDSKRRECEFVSVPTRPIADLPRFSAWLAAENRFMDPTEVDRAIRDRVESVRSGIDGKIVRLIMDDIPRDLFRDLDHRRLRDYRARALHFHLDARRPTRRRQAIEQRAAKPKPLDEEATEFLTEVWQPSSGDIDRGRLVELAQHYLALAGNEPDEPLIETQDV
jgi:hypothetical protein